ncbi:hypothetical protein NPIL_222831 [Nephila pilipes]|uniref:Uncharacterized protein n=1 Tax=Nephila pilipes TaxID=299642 RepID=A0A8X6U670_NEPPI|nr:hypothetical protein NPIL_222831 [Nephila pilipes]
MRRTALEYRVRQTFSLFSFLTVQRFAGQFRPALSADQPNLEKSWIYSALQLAKGRETPAFRKGVMTARVIA